MSKACLPWLQDFGQRTVSACLLRQHITTGPHWLQTENWNNWWLKQATEGIYPSGTFICSAGDIQEQRHCCVGATVQKPLGGVGAVVWTSALVFSYNYSIICLLISCPRLVDEFVCLMMAYWSAVSNAGLCFCVVEKFSSSTALHMQEHKRWP